LTEFKGRSKPHEPRNHPGYDPLRSARNDAPGFNRSWLKNGGSMTLVQRIGFTIFSVMFCLAGFYMCVDAVKTFRADDAGFIFSALVGVPFLILGALGLRNVVRFRRDRSNHQE
jgi:hypothetical protein